MKIKSRKIYSGLMATLLLLQNFIPALFIFTPNQVIAKTSPSVEDVNLSFDSASHSFNLLVQTNQKLSYILTYVDESQVPAVEQAAAGDLAKIENGIFGAEVFVGTCSGEDCVPVVFSRGSLFLGDDFKESFQLIDGKIVFGTPDVLGESVEQSIAEQEKTVEPEGFPTKAECQEIYTGSNHMPICHATNSESNPYVLVEANCNGIYGGHLNDDGTPISSENPGKNHSDDVPALFDDTGNPYCPGGATVEIPSYQCGETLYSVNNDSNLGLYDFLTNDLISIDSLTFGSSASADDPNNHRTYYIERYGNQLAYFDHDLVTHVLVGSTGINNSPFTKLAFNANGDLYGLTDKHHLYSIDTSTGVSSDLGLITGIGTGGDITFDEAGVLFLIDTSGKLFEVNIGTLAANLISETGLTPVTGMAYLSSNNKLYLSTHVGGTTSNLYSMDRDGNNIEILNDESLTLINDLSSCVTTQEPVAFCGDGIVNQDQEQCDYGSLNGDSNCSFKCTWNYQCKEVMVTNGSFEAPAVTHAKSWNAFDNASVEGWTAKWYGGATEYNGHDRPEPMIELHRGVLGAASDREQYVELDSDWTGPDGSYSGEPASIELSQEILTIVGNEYTVSWDYAARPSYSGNQLVVAVGGSEVFDSGLLAGDDSIVWQSETYTFIATSDLTTISFTETGVADSKGMFLDNVQVECLGVPPEVCQEGPAWASEVVSSKQGTLKNGGAITDPSRVDPLKVLGETDAQFFSLGYGGTIEVSFMGYVIDEPNSPDLSFHEVTNGRSSYPVETALIEVSQDGLSWVSLGEVDNKAGGNGVGYKDLAGSGLSWVKYVRITDITNDPSLPSNADGYDLTAIDVTHQVCDREDLPTQIQAYKVVCDSEEDLPNWGDDAGGLVTQSTAEDYVAQSKGQCKLVPDWDFEWGLDGNAPKQSGEYVGYAAGGWSAFDVKTGDSSPATASIINSENKTLWFREVLQEDYIPFTYPPDSSPGSNVSAEFYCNDDHFKYDNYESIANAKPGSTYYCVAFNSPKTQPVDVAMCKVDENGEPLVGWTLGLSKDMEISQPVPVDGTVMQIALTPADYVVYGSGTYKYGSSVMIADSGYSYRPANIPFGNDDWVSGDVLSTPGALEMMIQNQNVDWGTYSPAHTYSKFYPGFSDATMDFNIYDDNYSDNLNNGNFNVSIEEVVAYGVTGKDGCVTLESIKQGDYRAFEVPQEDWAYAQTSMEDVIQTSYPATISLDDDNPEIIIQNEYIGVGSIEGVKYFDQDQDGEFDENESTLPGWGVSILGDGVDQKVLTDENGNYSFSELPKGSYTVCEEDKSEEGWIQTEPVSQELKAVQDEEVDQELSPLVCHEIEISQGGEIITANFGNFIESRLYIEKINDAWPNDKSVGDEVTYTIKVMAVGGPVSEAEVLDLPPDPFDYVLGSYTADSSTGNDLKDEGTTTEPTYASPGKWILGDLVKDEIITLTYKAKIADIADPGVYPDMVWATGTSAQNNAIGGVDSDLLALSDPDFSADSESESFNGSQGHYGDDNFAGTQVALVVDQTPTDSYGVARTEEVQGQVLGASTELPATGAHAWLTILSVASSLVGAALIFFSNRKKVFKSKTLLMLLILVGFSLLSAKPAQAITSIRVEEPYNNSSEYTQNAVTNQSNMKIDFVVLNTENLNLVAQCQQQENDGSWVNITTNYSVKAGGNSGYCEANNLSNSKYYDFRVVVTGDTVTKYSDEVRVGIDTTKPSTPTSYQKNSKNNCEYEIKFKTANDGQTSRVDVYRGENIDTFNASEGSRISQISIGPDQEYVFTTSKPDCDKAYYYIIRAFNDNNNASGLIGDREISKIIVSTGTASDQAVQVGAVLTNENFFGEIAGAETDTGEETGATDETANSGQEDSTSEVDEEGEVLGSTDDSSIRMFIRQNWLPIGLGSVLLIAVIAFLISKRNAK